MNHALMATSTVFMPDHRPDLEHRVEDDEDDAGDRVEHTQPQHARLEEGVDEEGAPAPSEDVEPVVERAKSRREPTPAVTACGILRRPRVEDDLLGLRADA